MIRVAASAGKMEQMQGVDDLADQPEQTTKGLEVSMRRTHYHWFLCSRPWHSGRRPDICHDPVFVMHSNPQRRGGNALPARSD